METFARAGFTFDVLDVPPGPGTERRGTAVLLHGFPQDRTAYAAVVPRLQAAGLRVLVPDQRGYSPGARPRGRRPYAMLELVDDVVALLDQAGVEAAHVVGHDWGGSVAWTFASRRSPRTLSLTALSTPHPAAFGHAIKHGDQRRRSLYMLGYQVPWVPERRLLARDARRARRLLRRSGLPELSTEHYVRRMQEPQALTAALAWYRALPFHGSLGAGVVRVPTVHVHGRGDPFFSPLGAEVTHRYVDAPFRSVALDAGHWLPETRPDEVAAAVLSHLG